MIKTMGLAVRREGMSVADFQRQWREVHGPIFAKVPGLRRYIQSHAIPELYEDYPPAYDGMAEAWFDDVEALRAAQATPEMQAAIEDGRGLFGSVRSLLASDVAQIDGGPDPRSRESMVKYIGLLTRLPGLSVPEFQRRWRDVHGPLVKDEFPGMRHYIQSHALPESYDGPNPPAYDGVPEAWFDSLDVFPFTLVRRTGAELKTPAALDSEATFVQPIPSLVTREFVIVG